jgi:hypothetical protein
VQQERLVAGERRAAGILRRATRVSRMRDPAASVRRNVSSSAYGVRGQRA